MTVNGGKSVEKRYCVSGEKRRFLDADVDFESTRTRKKGMGNRGGRP